MPVRINIPPTGNAETGFSCGEEALVAAVAYLLPNAKPLTRLRAEELTRKLHDHNTWPEELARIVNDYPELKATIYRAHPISFPLEDYIRHYYGEPSLHIVKETNLESLEEAVEECEVNYQYQIGTFDLEFVFDLITEDRTVIAWLDCNLLYEYETDDFKPHFNILTGYDLDCVSMHESGNSHTLPVAHQRVGHERFMDALGPTPCLLVLERA